jgi:hypothetical protein
MKRLILTALFILPTLSFASTYVCGGAGFSIDASTNPAEMRVTGNGFSDSDIINVKAIQTFDITVKGSSTRPVASLKLTIKEGAGSSTLLVSSASGVTSHSGLTCLAR